MPRLDDIFSSLRSANRKALMPFICGQHPAPGATAQLLPALQRAGADVVEIGFPFSDPIADGPVIAGAMHDALARGASVRSLLEEVASVRSTLTLGLVAMCSISLAYRFPSPGAFAAALAESGFDGIIVPDCPLEESNPIRDAAAANHISCALLVAPTTPPERTEAIAAASTGFVYLMARAGITGERSDRPDIQTPVATLRKATNLPIAAGFGIATPEQVREVVRHADAAIVGSALVRRIASASDPGAEAEAFTRQLASGLQPGAAVPA